MRNDKGKTQAPKAKYRVRNWATYNAGLINRGNTTMWIDDDVLAKVPDTEPTRGRPRLYSAALVQALLGLKTVFHLPLRALQGFAQSLHDLAFADLPVPSYTTVCRRAQTLRVKLPVIHSGEPLHLVVDSTGVKVYGEGEWKVLQRGYSKRRTWCKVHLALDANTGRPCAALMTHQDVADGEVLPELLDQIPTGEPIDIIGDGAYDTQDCYAAISARGAMPSVPSLWARRTDTRATEVAVRVGVLNRMAEHARPQSVRIV
ncbi:transposase [Burkholderia ubonensis]|uniref:IS5 family transposase n=1 Tax=Burkholderia ubonensis TaxID=101571 RepID=UPI00075ED683|nr:IS5 family transposase [Burkholderia ubonensis]KVC90614.1 transposase [Burkholderia ubonensis]KVZ21261.1 transposase [Burkholderia ubonensis]KWB25199.1 transposase [Burkholderia ubonensis]KWC30950.1 transposase [Burkholderia ubonensis]OJA81050.1 transposase [Burkholderia ubonensis]